MDDADDARAALVRDLSVRHTDDELRRMIIEAKDDEHMMLVVAISLACAFVLLLRLWVAAPLGIADHSDVERICIGIGAALMGGVLVALCAYRGGPTSDELEDARKLRSRR